MEIDFEKLTIDEIRNDIFNFRNDVGMQGLESYYSAPSCSEILGVSRKELSHSNFICWLLNDRESHGLVDYPIKKLLEILVKHGKQYQLDRYKPLFNAIVTDEIVVSELLVEKEKSLGKSGRLDIYVELQIRYEKKSRKLRLIIENKVGSKEHSDQTQKYYDYFEGLRNRGDINLYVFLTPISGIDLFELEEPECSCKDFIQIIYKVYKI